MRTLSKNNVCVIDYTYKYISPDKVEINNVRLRYLNGKSLEFDNLSALLEWCTNDRIALVFTYDFNFFGGFLDYWAFSNKILLYEADKTTRGGNGFSIAQECWNALYTGNGMLNFKVTLRRTKSTHRQALRRGRDSYHTTEFRGLAAYYGNAKLSEVICGLRLEKLDKLDLLVKLVEYLEAVYKEIAGVDFLSPHFLQSTYTVGRAARSLYLTIRYGKDSLSQYQREHPQDEATEDYFRERKLLLGGMCICNLDYKGKLFLRKPPDSIKKYDVNGLYSFIANECGELAPPQMSDEDTFFGDDSGDYAYIIVLRELLAFRKKDKSAVFTDPFTHIDGDIIDINTEFAIWGELYTELENFYDIEEGRIVRVYRCKKMPDPAIIEYNRRLLAFKDKGRADNNRALYVISKIFLNALIGKFLQATKSATIKPFFDEKNDLVRLEYGDSVNNWAKAHFDFLRGSYIYTMARVKVMRDLIKVFKGKKMYYKHWYTDTDSIVTDIDFPPEMLSQTELGKYKIEERYAAFGVIGKKVYYGRTIDGTDKLTAAGLPKDELLNAISTAFPNGLTPQQYFDFLNSGDPLELPTRMRTRGGCAVVQSKHTVNAPLPLEYL